MKTSPQETEVLERNSLGNIPILWQILESKCSTNSYFYYEQRTYLYKYIWKELSYKSYKFKREFCALYFHFIIINWDIKIFYVTVLDKARPGEAKTTA